MDRKPKQLSYQQPCVDVKTNVFCEGLSTRERLYKERCYWLSISVRLLCPSTHDHHDTGSLGRTKGAGSQLLHKSMAMFDSPFGPGRVSWGSCLHGSMRFSRPSIMAGSSWKQVRGSPALVGLNIFTRFLEKVST